jgi:predicted Rossmann fold flavoprotein
VIVIGAGPAGLAAAIAAASNGHKVLILEHLPSAGRKLLASGAGKCNLTNILNPNDMAERFAPEQSRFVKRVLLSFPNEKLLNFFRERGVSFHLVDDFYYFPVTNRANDILDVLLKELSLLGVELLCKSSCTDIEIVNNRVVSISTKQQKYLCKHLIISTGGPGYPALGGGNSIIPILEKANHKVISRLPALTQLKSPSFSNGLLSGIFLDNVLLSLDKKNSTYGTLLFTSDGISGPCALDISGRVSRLLYEGKSVKLSCNFLPHIDVKAKLEEFRVTSGKREMRFFLASLLPKKLAEFLGSKLNIQDLKAANLSSKNRDELITLLTAYPIEILGTGNLDKAMCTTGGVARNEIIQSTLQSKFVENLSFAGEVIDVDGPCGGYNIQWAFSSGFLAGSAICK